MTNLETLIELNKVEVLYILDELDIEEEIVDKAIEKLIKKDPLTISNLKSILFYLQYKYMLCLKEETDCDNDLHIQFIVRHIWKNTSNEIEDNIILNILTSSLLLNKEKIQSLIEHMLQQLIVSEELHLSLQRENSTIILKSINKIMKLCIDEDVSIFPMFIQNELERLLQKQHEIINLDFYSQTVPLWIRICNNCTILNVIWQNVVGSMNNNEKLNYIILCTLSQYYLPLISEGNNVILKSKVMKDVEFWQIIQLGLKNNDQIIRKCSIYLARRAVLCCEEMNWISVKNSDIFLWNSENSAILKESWNSLFILLETLEEKQSNLVLSAMKLFDHIKEIHYSWYYIALDRALSHNTNAVVFEAIQIALTKHVNPRDFPYTKILYALNNAAVFDHFKNEELNPLQHLLKKFLNNENFFLNFMESMTEIKLAPIPRYYVYSIIGKIFINNIDYHKLHSRFIDLFLKENVKSNIMIFDYSVECFTIDFIANHKLTRTIEDLLYVVEIMHSDYTMVHIDNILWCKFSHLISSCKENLIENLNFYDWYVEIMKTKRNIKALSIFILLISWSDVKLKNVAKTLLHYSMKTLQMCTCSNKLDCKDLCRYHFLLIIHIFNEICQYDKNNYFKVLIHELIYGNKEFKYCLYKNLKYLIRNSEYNVEYCFKILFCNSSDILEDYTIIIDENVAILQSLEDKINEKYCALKLLTCIVQGVNDNLEWSNAKKYNLISPIFKTANEILEKNNDLKKNRGDMLSKIFKEIVVIYIYNYKYVDLWNSSTTVDLYEKIIDFLEVGGSMSLKYVIDLCKILVPKMLDLCGDKIKFLVDSIWREIFGIRKSKDFSECLKGLIEIIFQNDLPSDITTEYSIHIFNMSEQIPDMVFELMHILNLDFANKSVTVDILVKALLFGNPLRRDQRVEKDILNQIMADHGECAVTNHMGKYDVVAKVRIIALNITFSQNMMTLMSVTTSLMHKLDTSYKSNSRYHCNSLHHRMLLRTLQVICLSSPVLRNNEKAYSASAEWCIQKLITQPHHVSSKLMLEWYISLYILNKDLSLDDDNLKKLKMLDIPIISLMTILFHVLKHRLSLSVSDENHLLIGDQLSRNLEYVIEFYLQYTMGKTFTLRLHAQYFILKLLQLVEKSTVYSKYKHISDVINKTFICYKSDENLQKILQDFYLNSFDVVKSLSMANIFYFIPYLTNVAEDECICLDLLKDIHCLRNSPVSTVDLISHVSITPEEKIFSEEMVETCNTNIQKKFIPWQKFLTDNNILTKGENTEHSELVVVATLVDRLPNLGGLARTCEVLGVKEYIVSSLRNLEDKQFQSVSMSSEKWLNISEKRPGNSLKEYILRMKNNGYSVIAAEQTASSVSLESFQFPKKSLLIVGHEKDGIPCDLLCLMDRCVEIPQHGMIRSLNVHVTASIFIWEYTKQHPII